MALGMGIDVSILEMSGNGVIGFEQVAPNVPKDGPAMMAKRDDKLPPAPERSGRSMA